MDAKSKGAWLVHRMNKPRRTANVGEFENINASSRLGGLPSGSSASLDSSIFAARVTSSRRHRRLSTLLVIAFAVLSGEAKHAASANVFGRVWNGVKSVGGGVVGGGQAVLSTGGNVLRWGLGATAGQAFAGVTDPMLDGAAARLKEAGDHIVDHAANKLGQTIDAELVKLDEIEKNRLNQLDAIMSNRLDQIDKLFDDKLSKLNEMATQILSREEQILDRSLDREQSILNSSITQVDKMLDKDIARLKGIEGDTFDRLEGAVQDQIPVAAGQVARAIEWTIAVVVFLIVLVGYGGIRAFRKFQFDNSMSISKRLVNSLRVVPLEALSVGIPMLLIAVVIQIGYTVYCRRADNTRISHLRDGAQLFEEASDFSAGANLRRRLASLDDGAESRFWVVRDRWLADFSLPSYNNTNELWARLVAIDTNYHSLMVSDAELRAAQLYIAERRIRRIVPTKDEDAVVLRKLEVSQAADMDLYIRNRSSDPRPPTLGKLVYMARIRLLLDSDGSLADRLAAAIAKCNEMIERYPSFPSGLVLRGQLKAIQADAIQKNPTATIKTDDGAAIADISNDLGKASVYDSSLVKLVKFSSFSLTDDEASKIMEYLTLKSDPALAKGDAATQARFAKLQDDASRRIEAASTRYTSEAQEVFGSETLSRTVELREFPAVLKRDLSDRVLVQRVDAINSKTLAGTIVTKDLYTESLAIAAAADDAGQPLVAEKWLAEAASIVKTYPAVATANASADLAKRAAKVQQTKISAGIAYVY